MIRGAKMVETPSNEFTWVRKEPRAVLWQDGPWGSEEGWEIEPSVPALTVHAGGKVAEDGDELIVRSVRYVHHADGKVLEICGSA